MQDLRGKSPKTPVLFRPRSIHEAWELKQEHGADAVYVSGSTLLRTQWEAGTVSLPKAMIDLRGLKGLASIDEQDGECFIGALTDLSTCRRSGELERVGPSLKEAARVIAAPAVRNLATIGGNIASGYGDALPALLVCGAELDIFDGRFTNRLSVEKWLASKWGSLHPPGDLLTGVRLAAPKGPEGARRFETFRKVGRREAFTPSLTTAAVSGFIGGGGVLTHIRIAAGGGSGRPQRLHRAEALLEGQVLNAGLLAPLYESVLGQFETYSDPFASEEYKKKTAGNLIAAELWKVMQETTGIGG